jgi:hypothetical protein
VKEARVLNALVGGGREKLLGDSTRTLGKHLFVRKFLKFFSIQKRGKKIKISNP